MADLIKKFESKTLDDVLIADAHMHLGKPSGFFSSADNAESLLKSMELNNISFGCISSYDSIGQDAPGGNREIEELVKKYPGKFVGQFGLNPNYPEEADRILKKAEGIKSFRQIKLHPGFHRYPIAGEQYHKAYEFAGEHGYSILVHTWGKEDVNELGKVAQSYDVDFLIGHSGGTPDGIKHAVEISHKLKNVYLDLTLSYNYQGLIEWLAKEADTSRLLFGSDATYNSQSASLGKIIYADIDDKVKLKILGENTANLLNKSKS